MVFITLGKLLSAYLLFSFILCSISFVVISTKKVNTREFSDKNGILDKLAEFSLAATLFLSQMAIILALTDKYFKPIFNAILYVDPFYNVKLAVLVICLFAALSVIAYKAAMLIWFKLAFMAIDTRTKRRDNPIQTVFSITYMPFSFKFKRKIMRYFIDEVKRIIDEGKKNKSKTE